jgi:hypothetical protein
MRLQKGRYDLRSVIKMKWSIVCLPVCSKGSKEGGGAWYSIRVDLNALYEDGQLYAYRHALSKEGREVFE